MNRTVNGKCSILVQIRYLSFITDTKINDDILRPHFKNYVNKFLYLHLFDVIKLSISEML